MPIEVGDIKFGEIDAKNELFQQGRYGSEVFLNSFQVPPRVNIDELLLGSRFFISGQKGCGKTALLLYLRHLLAEAGAKTHTILFKSDLGEAERQKISVGSDFEIILVDQSVSIQYEYVTNWLWVIYRALLRLIDPSSAYQGRGVLEDLKSIMGVASESRKGIFSDLSLTSIKFATKAGLNTKVVSGEIAADLELLKKDKDSLTSLQIIDLCEFHLKRVKLPPNKRYLVFFDELELFWNRPDQKERDLFLIRDLLKSVSRVNRALGEQSASLVVYASVRSEVIEEVNRVGPEIARDVADFGVGINWNVKANAKNQPILGIVEAKVNASEVEAGELPTGNVWTNYFPEKIHGRHVEEHLLDIAMFKPRHIVSRLNLAARYDPKSSYISAEALEETSTEFSSSVWREIEEELLVSYSAKQVSNLKAILTGFKSRLTVSDFERRVLFLSNIEKSIVDGFRTRLDVVKILTTLYRVGAVGNQYFVQKDGGRQRRDRWVFREYGDPRIEETFIIHESLRKTFQLPFD